jgi:lysophospholipase L1-like esterase
MKKSIIYTSSLAAICILAVILKTAYQYYAPPTERVPYKIAQNDDTLRIAYIGDSWAFIHQNEHQCLIPSIIETSCHIPTSIYSYGFPGRTSREIYEAIFDDKEQKKFLQNFGYSYCIVSAGINDANKKMSINYYRNSIDCIIRFLLSNHIHPIILEIPDYDIQKTFLWQKIDRKILYRISMAINNIPVDCKQIYRDALDDLIRKKGYQGKVSIIRYKSWNKNYDKDQNTLYRIDGIHLNDNGNAVLDSIIAKQIISYF